MKWSLTPSYGEVVSFHCCCTLVVLMVIGDMSTLAGSLVDSAPSHLNSPLPHLCLNPVVFPVFAGFLVLSPHLLLPPSLLIFFCNCTTGSITFLKAATIKHGAFFARSALHVSWSLPSPTALRCSVGVLWPGSALLCGERVLVVLRVGFEFI